MAPEVLAHQRYSEKADVYSFGVVLWECTARQARICPNIPQQGAAHLCRCTPEDVLERCSQSAWGSQSCSSAGSLETESNACQCMHVLYLGLHGIQALALAQGCMHAGAARGPE